MTFWGKYQGIDYPAGYTKEEREIIKPFLGDRAGEKFQFKPKKVKGKLCRAGHTYAVIFPDGTVLRCGGDQFSELQLRWGNFFNDNFKLLEEPLSCDAEYCPCNEWAFLLVDDNK